MVDYFLGLGVLMLLALIGVYIVRKYGQSVILAYIVVGILIGPNLAFEFLGHQYHGIITNREMIDQLLEVGLIFLFFFVGLEFSITRLRETKKAAAAIAITHVSMNLFVGFGIATIFKWDLYGSIFLAVVIGVSSAAVATKTLKDLNRLSGRETKFMLTSIIIEDFILIIIIALASGSAMRGGDLAAWDIVRLISSVCFLYTIFLLLGFIIVPRLYHYLEKIQSDELFVLFALMLIFMAPVLAEMLQIPRPLGALFMGMTFAESKFSDSLIQKLNSIRLGFTAVFFMSFGMMISFSMDMISIIIPMLLITVPLIIFNQVVVLGSISFFLGFKPKEAVTIGSCLAGRGEDTLLYASVGANLEVVGSTDANVKYYLSETGRNTLFSFSGIYCFIMATLAPIIVRNVKEIVGFLSSITPKKWAFGGNLIHRTMRTRMFSVGGPFIPEEKNLLALFGAYSGALFGVILIREIPLFILFLVIGIIVLYLLRNAVDAYIGPCIDLDLYREMHLLVKNEKGIHQFIIGTLMKLIATPFIVSVLWGIAQISADFTDVYVWWVAIVGALLIIGWIAFGNEKIYEETMERPVVLRKEQMMRGVPGSWDTNDAKGRRGPAYGRRSRNRPKKAFKPVKYDELIPKKRSKKDGGLSLKGLGRTKDR
jgi:CPA2 family monovalent cation:H+ antiporter-2